MEMFLRLLDRKSAENRKKACSLSFKLSVMYYLWYGSIQAISTYIESYRYIQSRAVYMEYIFECTNA